VGSSASSEKTILNDTVRLGREEMYGGSPKKGLDKANLLRDVIEAGKAQPLFLTRIRSPVSW